MQRFLQRGEDVGRALDIAGGSETEADLVLPFWVEGKLGVEGGYSVKLRQGQVQLLGNDNLNLLRQIAEDFLRGLEHRHGGSGLTPVGLDYFP
ncbi:hypothetical protein SDC9_169264 [bioreactor metagenome]|uniref:Uncharacterized protein n=1 Tax=bioreactor metagenome TaxID=1076179 RepID=A0A645G7D6_9ZZZZ